MARSNASSNAASRQGLLPVCGCGVAMRIWIANTAVNCGRRFWKCKNFGKAASCDLFLWDDELDFETMRMVSVSEANEDLSVSEATQRVCQCKCGQISKDLESKKIAKLKLKLCDERKKMRWMQAFVGLVIVVLLYQKFDMVKK